MLDINKALSEARHDPEGNMFDLAQWSPLVAQRQAQAEGLYLSDYHWQIIIYLRERFRAQGRAHSARELQKELDEKFSEGRGTRYLYELFPGGPVNQGSRLAGLPPPPYASDPSFGSVQ
jgi:tRNA 2-thiouridine synthesizing protein E